MRCWEEDDEVRETSHSTCQSSGVQGTSHSTCQSLGVQDKSHSTCQSSGVQGKFHSICESLGMQDKSHSTSQSLGVQGKSHSTCQSSGAQGTSHSTCQSSGVQGKSHSTSQSSGVQGTFHSTCEISRLLGSSQFTCPVHGKSHFKCLRSKVQGTSDSPSLNSNGVQESAESANSSEKSPSETSTSKICIDKVCHIDKLPSELLLKVFSFLTQKDLCFSIALVCQQWREISVDPSLWTRLVFPKNPPDIFKIHELITTRARHLLHFEIAGYKSDAVCVFEMVATYCPRLRHLTFDFCDTLTELSSELLSSGCPNLRHLSLEGSQVESTRCFHYLARLTNLTFLNLSHCRNLDDSGLLTIANNCRNLQYLNIDGITSIHDNSVVGLARLLSGSLHHLLIDGENLSDIAYKAIGACTNLVRLGVSFCEKMTDAGLLALSPLKNLTCLKLRKGCQLQPTGMNNFIKSDALSHLTHLNLGECALLDDSVLFSVAARCPNLEHLELNWCWDVTDAGITMVASKCPRIRALILIGVVQLTNMILPILLDSLTELAVLDLEQCNAIDESSLQDLVNHRPSLRVFDYWGDLIEAS